MYMQCVKCMSHALGRDGTGGVTEVGQQRWGGSPWLLTLEDCPCRALYNPCVQLRRGQEITHMITALADQSDSGLYL